MKENELGKESKRAQKNKRAEPRSSRHQRESAEGGKRKEVENLNSRPPSIQYALTHACERSSYSFSVFACFSICCAQLDIAASALTTLL